MYFFVIIIMIRVVYFLFAQDESRSGKMNCGAEEKKASDIGYVVLIYMRLATKPSRLIMALVGIC